MKTELKPCPFCGAREFSPAMTPDPLRMLDPVKTITSLEDEDGGLVSCICCGASINAPTVEEAIERWNKRA